MSETTSRWPVTLSGVTESVVSTLGPNERWNVAALGIHAPESADDPPTARTWGRTRTWRNFEEHGEGYVQFVQDPVLYVDAALSIHEVDDPVLDQAYAWVCVSTSAVNRGQSGETEFVDWELTVEESGVECRTVPAFKRGRAAVIEATVAASRLDVEAYDSDELWDRICYFEDVADRCGGPQERQAFKRLLELIEEP